MPRYLKQNGDKVPNVKMQRTWIVIPIKSKIESIPLEQETYLVQPRVAEYIDKLESRIKGELPKLSAGK